MANLVAVRSAIRASRATLIASRALRRSTASGLSASALARAARSSWAFFAFAAALRRAAKLVFLGSFISIIRSKVKRPHAGPHRRTGIRRGSDPARRLVVLSVADMRAPGGALALLAGFRQRQMREQAIGCGAVPVHRIRRDIDRIARVQHLRLLALEADAADAGQTEERLPHRVGVPRGAGARREGNHRTSKTRRCLSGDHRILEHDAGEGVGRTPPCGARPGANYSGLYWHGCPPSSGGGLAVAK